MIKAVIFLTLLAAANAATSPICAKVVCGTPSSGCVSFKDSTYTIKPCPTDKQCSIADFPVGGSPAGTMACIGNPAPPKPTKPTNLVAGSACTTDDNCAKKSCSGGICQGLGANATGCVVFSTTLSDDDKAKVCGAGLYCNGDAKCVSGIAVGKTCSGTAPCAYPAVCSGSGTCVALDSVDKGKTCNSNLVCKTDLFCNDGTCADALPYTKGKPGFPCSANDDCTSECLCGITNTEGKGFCGPVATSYTSKDNLNAQRSYTKDHTDMKCPLLNQKGAGCFDTYKAPFGSFSYGSCYSSFEFGITPGDFSTIATTPANSSVQIVVSFVAFFFYLLF